jgi:hypothetical protein
MDYKLFSNQQIINAFYYAQRTLDPTVDPWGVITLAGLASLADHRRAVYDCPPIDQLGLSAALEQAVIAQLAMMTPVFRSDVQPRRGVLLNVPWVSQLDNAPDGADCGQACVLMLLRYYNSASSPVNPTSLTVRALVELMRDIDEQHGKPRRLDNSTTANDLVNLAAANGLQLKRHSNFESLDSAVEALNNGYAVVPLVDYIDLQLPDHLQSGSDQGPHWLVIIGHSNSGRTFIVHDPLWALHQNGGHGGAALPITRETLQSALHSDHVAVY